MNRIKFKLTLCAFILAWTTVPAMAQDFGMRLFEIGEGWVEVFDSANSPIAHAYAWPDENGRLNEIWLARFGTPLPLGQSYRAVHHGIPDQNAPGSQSEAQRFVEAKAAEDDLLIGSIVWFAPAQLPVRATVVETYPFKVKSSDGMNQGAVVIRKYQCTEDDGVKTYCADVAGIRNGTRFPLEINFTTHSLPYEDWQVPDLQLAHDVETYCRDVLRIGPPDMHFAYFEVSELQPTPGPETRDQDQIGEGWVEVFDSAAKTIGHARAWRYRGIHREIWVLDKSLTPYSLPTGARMKRGEGPNINDPDEVEYKLQVRCFDDDLFAVKTTKLHLRTGRFEESREGHREYQVRDEEGNTIGYWVIRSYPGATKREFALLSIGVSFPFSSTVTVVESGRLFADLYDIELESQMRREHPAPGAQFVRVEVIPGLGE
ncbi:MAG: hypothetical protein AAF488_11380 [Planctomycetota bacterium]